MKAALKMKERKLFYFQNGNKIEGANPNLYGGCTELYGDCTELRGDLDDCKITITEREQGILINDLVEKL